MILLGNLTEIKTGIDRFLDLVNTDGETKVSAAAAKLKVPADTIEIWAEILQQDNLIEIGYDGFGKMTVKPKTPEQAKETEKVHSKAQEHKEGDLSRGFSILKNMKEKSIWKKNREIKNKNRYLKRLNTSDKDEKNAAKETVFSKILKRLGVKNK